LPGSSRQNEAVWGGLPPGTANVSPASGPRSGSDNLSRQSAVVSGAFLACSILRACPKPAGCRRSQRTGAPGTPPSKSPRAAICLVAPAKGPAQEMDLQFSPKCTRSSAAKPDSTDCTGDMVSATPSLLWKPADGV